ncbi:hypothetical protein Psal006b_00225 [Piscirickettsia salmonis]|uniref:RHS repeat domain protein n=1 Tax=Piscirickettsia salmonis TaxID=1238 RepID=A0A1L6TF44_PISSA|nr:hypothetical protein [Piscirickettsia salmonis]AKP72414.1 hypothetical protein PSLF89_233 [Piscirickettsia salmonis LF-89 = ATCC VR-1361]ALB24128.1 RHS repeat domain protein [Piscirickettsia salmonis]ALY03935.1 hypothetical protein AWE47_14560 [Piscirickettsia salmonis]AMA43496.1 hypothetical protein AWJ11_14775 [Piscirickettsia salmonis]AOS35965.1 hypothetical protein AVM72_11890 [Piscirickettsia salmonis]
MPKSTPKIIKLKSDRCEKICHFRFIKNDNKAKIWTSKYQVRCSTAQKIISNYCKNNKPLYILSGSHGNKSGENAITNKELKEESFFLEDKERYETMSPRIKIIDITMLTKKEYKSLIRNTARDALLFYCYSRNDTVVKEALRCASPEALYTRETPPPPAP